MQKLALGYCFENFFSYNTSDSLIDFPSLIGFQSASERFGEHSRVSVHLLLVHPDRSRFNSVSRFDLGFHRGAFRSHAGVRLLSSAPASQSHRLLRRSAHFPVHDSCRVLSLRLKCAPAHTHTLTLIVHWFLSECLQLPATATLHHYLCFVVFLQVVLC